MTTTPTAAPSAEPAPTTSHEDELSIGGFGWWAMGGALGTALTAFIAFIVLIQVNAPAREVREPTPGSAGSPLAEVTLVAAEFSFDPFSVFVTPEATITMDNQGAIFHNLEIAGIEGFLLEADPGVSAVGQVMLEPGDYVIFCAVPGHRESGMEGELRVAGE